MTFTCSASPSVAFSLRGPDLFRAATQRQKSGVYPEAALHIVELDSRTVYGVFRCNSCPDWKPDEFETWRINESPAELSKYLSDTIISAFEQAVAADDSNGFEQAGEALYSKLFAQDSGQQSEAESKFIAFVRANQNRTEPASLFVRLLPHNPEPLFMVPFGLLAVPTGGDTPRFLGLDFAIETPLEIQDYASAASCISNWVLLVPPDDPNQAEMKSARDEFSNWIDLFNKWNGHAKVYENIGLFGQWIAPTGAAPIDNSTALVIVSHHDHNKFFFNKEQENPSFLSAPIGRTFTSPSVAIVNACGTAKPGAYDFIKELNRHGITSVIATSTEVDSQMSGRFLELLMNLLRDHMNDPNYSLGRAKFESVRALTKIPKNKPYGPRALIYTLIGNANLKLCPTDSKNN